MNNLKLHLKIDGLLATAFALAPLAIVGGLAGKGIRSVGNAVAKGGELLAKASIEPFNAVGRKMWEIHDKELPDVPVSDLPQLKID